MCCREATELCHRAKSGIDCLWWLQQEATQQIAEQRQAETDSGSRQPDLAFKNCRDLKPWHLVCLSVWGTYRTHPTQTLSSWLPSIPSIAACRDALDSVRVSSFLYLSLCFQWCWCIPTLSNDSGQYGLMQTVFFPFSLISQTNSWVLMKIFWHFYRTDTVFNSVQIQIETQI